MVIWGFSVLGPFHGQRFQPSGGPRDLRINYALSPGLIQPWAPVGGPRLSFPMKKLRTWGTTGSHWLPRLECPKLGCLVRDSDYSSYTDLPVFTNSTPTPRGHCPQEPWLVLPPPLLHLKHSLKQGWSSNHTFRSSFSSHELSSCKQQLGSVYSWPLPLIHHDLYLTYSYTCHRPQATRSTGLSPAKAGPLVCTLVLSSLHRFCFL